MAGAPLLRVVDGDRESVVGRDVVRQLADVVEEKVPLVSVSDGDRDLLIAIRGLLRSRLLAPR